MEMLKVPFLGNELIIVSNDGEPYVVMRSIVDSMGLDWKSQYNKIFQRFRSCVVEITMQLPYDVQRRKVVCMKLKKLPAWLYTIQPNKVKPEIRERIIRFQEECDEVLWQYWTTGVARRDEVKARLAAIDEAEYQSAIRGSMAGRELNRRRLEKRELERQKFAVLQMDLFFQAA